MMNLLIFGFGISVGIALGGLITAYALRQKDQLDDEIEKEWKHENLCYWKRPLG